MSDDSMPEFKFEGFFAIGRHPELPGILHMEMLVRVGDTGVAEIIDVFPADWTGPFTRDHLFSAMRKMMNDTLVKLFSITNGVVPEGSYVKMPGAEPSGQSFDAPGSTRFN